MEHVQKLISTRRGSFYVAAIAAVLAGVVILAYLNQYRDSVRAGGAPVTVLVARTTIPKGTAGNVIASKQMFVATTIRETQLREGAISDPASLKERVATTEIYEGAQLTSAEFSTTVTSLASSLTERQRIVSLPLDAAHGLTGQVEEGDHVDVYGGFNVIPLAADGRPAAGGQARPVLRLIVADVPVVQVGDAGSGGLGSQATNVSLRVNDKQAAKLAFSSDNGKVWLSLRPIVGAKASRPDIVTLETLLLGVRPITVVHVMGGRR
jgi:Flp pilus assembly protein CpaB